MAHTVFFHAPDAQTFTEAAAAANASEWHSYPAPSGRLICYVREADRFALRQQSTVNILPPHSSPKDITADATALGFSNVKTARELFSAVFALTNVDMFDPDL
jgi:hypothetical protein